MAKTKMRRVNGGSEVVSTEHALIRAAATLISSKGFAATSIQDIATEAGVAKGAFYYYFASKHDVLTLLLNRFLDHLLAITEDIAGSGASPPEKLEALVAALVGAVGEHKEDVAVFIQQRRDLPDESSAEVQARNEALVRQITAVLDEGCQRGDFRPQPSTRALAFGVLGMCSWAYQWFRPGLLTLEQIGAMYSQLILHGLRAADAPNPVVELRGNAIDHDDSTKAKLTEAAIDLFCEQGYMATSIDDIAGAVNLTKGAFYVYFTSKEDMLRHIHSRVLDQLLSDMNALITTPGGASSSLAVLVGEMVGMVRDRRPELAVFWRERRFLTAETFEDVRRKGDLFSDRMAAVIDHGVATGEFAPLQGAKPVVLGMIGMCSWGYQWHRPGEDLPLEEIAQMYVDVLLNGLLQTH